MDEPTYNALEGYAFDEEGAYWTEDFVNFYTFEEIKTFEFYEDATFYAVAKSNMFYVYFPFEPVGLDGYYEDLGDGVYTFHKDYSGINFGFEPPFGIAYEVYYMIGADNPLHLLEDLGVNEYYLDGSAITDDIYISVEEYYYADAEIISGGDYIGAPDGYNVLRLTIEDDYFVPGTYLFDGEPMLWSDNYYAYVAMVPEDLEDYEALAMITYDEDGDGNEALAYNGDVDGDGAVDATDIQLVLLMFNGIENSDYPYTTAMRFEADANCDGMVDMQDLFSIYYRIYPLPPLT